VEIMKLVGATNWFIRWPFLIEGVTVGVVGAVFAAAVVLVLNSVTVSKISGNLTFMRVPLDAVPYTTVTLILLAVGVVIGAAGSGLGLRRFLKI
jgi:cell division transport system permease protein